MFGFGFWWRRSHGEKFNSLACVCLVFFCFWSKRPERGNGMRRARNENGFFNWPQQQQRRRRRQQHQQQQQQKRKRVAVCVCVLWNEKMVPFFFGCGKVWGKKLPKIPAEPTTSSSGRADAEVDADGPAFMRNAIQNDCFQANTHTRGSSGRRCHGDALPRPSVATRPERRTRTASFECNAF